MINKRTRVRRSLAAVMSAATIGTMCQTSCVTGRKFREAAVPAVRTGVTEIVNGLLDGLFAAIEPDATSDAGSSGE